MAFNPSNDHWFTGYSSDGTDITLPIATFPELTTGEAHTTTGDVRKFLLAFCEYTYLKYVSEASNDPAKMVISRSRSWNDSAGVWTYNYGFAFTVEPGSFEVAAE